MIALMTVTLKLEMLQVNMFARLLTSEFPRFWCAVAHLTSYGRWEGAREVLGLGAA